MSNTTTEQFISTDLPLFMKESGEEQINKRRKELEIYVNLLSADPIGMINRTLISLNPHTLNPYEVGQKEATAIENWWKTETTKHAIFEWLGTNEHKVNGEYGNWSAGCMGSRWADCEINGRSCRFAFYSKKYNPTSFSPEMTANLGKEYNYALMIDPTN